MKLPPPPPTLTRKRWHKRTEIGYKKLIHKRVPTKKLSNSCRSDFYVRPRTMSDSHPNPGNPLDYLGRKKLADSKNKEKK